MLRTSAAFLVIVFAVASSLLADAPKRVIDMHLHVYQSDPRWEQRTPNPATGKPLTACQKPTIVLLSWRR
jgi:hypothetical protein